MQIFCFGLHFDSLKMPEALERVDSFLTDGQQHYIATPNPEMVMLAEGDAIFRLALQGADLNLVDGFGLALALRWLTHQSIHRVAGADFLEALLAHLRGAERLFFLGGLCGVAARAAAVAGERWETAVVGVAEPPYGTYRRVDATVLEVSAHRDLINLINERQPSVLIIALGHGLQEKWLMEYLPSCPSVRVAVAVGGSLDYLSGNIRRAPSALRRIGLEWLWRLGRQPTRLPRIFRATVFFSYEALRWAWRMTFFYRPSVVGCILNQQGKVLLVARTDDPAHWQFPQGGQEPGETPLQAVRREMREELGLIHLELIGQSRPNVHRYVWGRTFGTMKAEQKRCHYGYRGQRQTVFYFTFAGQDREIVLDRTEHTAWQWTPRQQLLSVLHPVRRTLGTIILQALTPYA